MRWCLMAAKPERCVTNKRSGGSELGRCIVSGTGGTVALTLSRTGIPEPDRSGLLWWLSGAGEVCPVPMNSVYNRRNNCCAITAFQLMVAGIVTDSWRGQSCWITRRRHRPWWVKLALLISKKMFPTVLLWSLAVVVGVFGITRVFRTVVRCAGCQYGGECLSTVCTQEILHWRN